MSTNKPGKGSKRSNGEGTIGFDDGRQRYVGRITIGMKADGTPVRQKFVGNGRDR
jgi:hypothetical protein